MNSYENIGRFEDMFPALIERLNDSAHTRQKMDAAKNVIDEMQQELTAAKAHVNQDNKFRDFYFMLSDMITGSFDEK
jgi:hypothetical protein